MADLVSVVVELAAGLMDLVIVVVDVLVVVLVDAAGFECLDPDGFGSDGFLGAWWPFFRPVVQFVDDMTAF